MTAMFGSGKQMIEKLQERCIKNRDKEKGKER